ncbi:MAG: dTMP kinase [Chlamydiota bacterium]|jgi:dTMP kinase
MSKGIFITFEGGEGAGKSTIIDRAYSELLSQGYSAIKTIEPGGTFIGDNIREILLFSKEKLYPFCELGLFLASRAQHVQDVILPALEEGKIVLCDRFHDSTIAYQGIARGLGEKKIHDLCMAFSDSLEPNLTIYLDIDPKIGLQRSTNSSSDRIEQEKIEFHQKVREAFLSLQEKSSQRMKKFDASQPLVSVFDLVYKQIRSVID